MASSLTLYGLKTCDTCRKALKALQDVPMDVTFVDLRRDGNLGARLPGWLESVGTTALLNTRSTTWRTLSESERAAKERDDGVLELLNTHPSLIKRPVIVADDGTVMVGWTPEVRERLGL